MPRHFLLFTLALTCAAAVQAVHVPGHLPADEDPTGEQLKKRREALRASLKAPVDEGDTSRRRLSPEQKAELRQQLRQQEPGTSDRFPPQKEKNTP